MHTLRFEQVRGLAQMTQYSTSWVFQVPTTSESPIHATSCSVRTSGDGRVGGPEQRICVAASCIDWKIGGRIDEGETQR